MVFSTDTNKIHKWTKMDRNGEKRTENDRNGQGGGEQKKTPPKKIMWHMSCVTSCMSHVTNANSHSHRPSPSELLHYAQQAGLQKQKKTKNCKLQTIHRNNPSSSEPILGISSLTRSLPSTGKRGFQEGTNITQTLLLID